MKKLILVILAAFTVTVSAFAKPVAYNETSEENWSGMSYRNVQIVKILDSKDVNLMTNETPLSKSYKVYCAKDIKGPKSNKMKVFIDCSNIITKDTNSGRYICRGNNIDIFISYLVWAMHTFIYYADEPRITNNSQVRNVGARAFA